MAIQTSHPAPEDCDYPALSSLTAVSHRSGSWLGLQAGSCFCGEVWVRVLEAQFTVTNLEIQWSN